MRARCRFIDGSDHCLDHLLTRQARYYKKHSRSSKDYLAISCSPTEAVFQTAAEYNDCCASNLRAIGCCTHKNCLQELQTVRLVNTSAFVGTNPMGELITSRLPVIGSEPQQFRQADFNDASRKPLPRPVPVAPRAC